MNSILSNGKKTRSRLKKAESNEYIKQSVNNALLLKAKKIMDTFKVEDIETHKDPEKHNIDWKNILKNMAKETYKPETIKNPKTDHRLTHDPLPNARL